MYVQYTVYAKTADGHLEKKNLATLIAVLVRQATTSPSVSTSQLFKKIIWCTGGILWFSELRYKFQVYMYFGKSSVRSKLYFKETIAWDFDIFFLSRITLCKFTKDRNLETYVIDMADSSESAEKRE
jgi:hypothetical protein